MKKTSPALPVFHRLRHSTRSGTAGRLAAGALALACLGGNAHAANFGHARLASSVGEPLLILVPVSGLTDADLQALSARPAPAADWAQAGLMPPVPLDTLSVSVGDDTRAGGRRVLRIGSGQAFSGNLADLLLDVHTATGEQRYQVSLIAPGAGRTAAAPGAAQSAGQGGASAAVGAAADPARTPHSTIAVRRGDTMFALARRHATGGVSIYQWMMALQRANPQAFIHDNINLVRAGASLAVPDINDMLSISDAEARRQFQAQVAAFAQMRGRLAGDAATTPAGQAATGSVSQGDDTAAAPAATGSGDHLRLSESAQAGSDPAADARTARGHALKDTESRVDQLQDNVQHLNQALRAQGEAARNAAAQGAEAIGRSVQEIASAISTASEEAAAQADAEESAGGATPAGGASGAAASRAAEGGHAAAGAGSAAANETAGSSAAGAGNAMPGISSAVADTVASGNTAAGSAAATASSSAENQQHRVSWLQDHLLSVMVGLLAFIVVIIAWLLRRANAARDRADSGLQATEAMVRERIQDIDLDLKPGDTQTPRT